MYNYLWHNHWNLINDMQNKSFLKFEVKMKKIRLNIFLFTVLIAGLLFLTANDNFGISGGNQWKVPGIAKKLKNPVPANKVSLKLGEKLYAQNCATCHGEGGLGDGPGGKYIGKKVANLTSKSVQDQPDGVLYYKITRGRAPMPAYKTILKTKERWAVVNYIRSLKSK